MSLLELYLTRRLTFYGYPNINAVLIVKDDEVFIGLRGSIEELSSVVCERFLRHNPSGEGKYGQLRDQFKVNLMNDLLTDVFPKSKLNASVLYIEDNYGIPHVDVIHEFNPIDDLNSLALGKSNKVPTALELMRIKSSIELVNSYLGWLIKDVEFVQKTLQDEIKQLIRSYVGRTDSKILWSFETQNYLVRVFAVPVDWQETSERVRGYSQLHLEEQAFGNGELFTLKAEVTDVWNQAKVIGVAEHINCYVPRPSSINTLTRMDLNKDVNAVAIRAIKKARLRINDMALR
ncbi:hypothetical protein ACT3UJ_06410 [Halomonas sp. 86]|uniref:hypothetical protein n=1 Tax=unclassified Halomonas TaxID=2609666 RepID=UPI0040332D47